MTKTKASEAQVMISLRVGTQAKNSRIIEEVLEKAGYNTWICIEMEGGVDFRDQIVETVDNIDVMILMIDTEWATSGECEAEFNLAYRKHLTSKERPRKPTFLPIVFPNLDWNAHKHIRLLLASTNAIVVDKNTMMKDVAESLLSSIRNLGIVPRVPPTEESSSSSSSGKVSKPERNLDKAVLYWDTEDICYYLEKQDFEVWTSKFREQKVTGIDLIEASEQELKEGLGVTSFFVRKFYGDLKQNQNFDDLQGDWSCSGKMSFSDGNEYFTNHFVLTLKNWGVVCSGIKINQSDPSKQDMRSLSTIICQGTYDSQRNVHIICKLSTNSTLELIGQMNMSTSRTGVMNVQMSEKPKDSARVFGTADFKLDRLVGRNRFIPMVDGPTITKNFHSTIERASFLPTHLVGLENENLDNLLFCWREFKREDHDSKVFRGLTIEPVYSLEKSGTPFLIPYDLFSDDKSYYDAFFIFGCATLNGKIYITLENIPEGKKDEYKSTLTGEVRPWAFIGTNGYLSNEIEHACFNWRWWCGKRIVTLETK